MDFMKHGAITKEVLDQSIGFVKKTLDSCKLDTASAILIAPCYGSHLSKLISHKFTTDHEVGKGTLYINLTSHM